MPPSIAADLNQDGVIIYSPVTDGPLIVFRVGWGSNTGNDDHPERGETTHRWPFFLPDGKHYLYLVGVLQAKGKGQSLR